jgi:hypothetical protein
MQTHIIDKDGVEILIDGKLAEGSNEFFITKDMLVLAASFLDSSDCLHPNGKDDKEDKKGNTKKYRILRDNNNNRCTIDFMGGEVGGRTELGAYDTYEQAMDGLKDLTDKGECGVPKDP